MIHFLILQAFVGVQAMVAALGNAKEYTLKQYLAFAEKLQAKAKVCAFEFMCLLKCCRCSICILGCGD
jgi:hypothetical protein